MSYRVGSSNRPLDRLVVWGRVNALCVISRAREAAAERGESGPGGGAGRRRFSVLANRVGGEAAAPAVSSTMSYRVGSSNRPLDRLVVWGRVNALCVISRAREAAAERGEFGPGGGAGRRRFSVLANRVGGEAAAPAVSSTMSYRVGSSNRPLDRLVVWGRVNALCVISRAREAAAERGEFGPGGGAGRRRFSVLANRVGGEAAAPAVSSTMSYRVGSSNRPLDRLVVWGRVNALCVISRAREAAAERGEFGPGGGAGRRRFSVLANRVGGEAAAPAVSSTMSYRVGSGNRPLDRLVVWGRVNALCVISRAREAAAERGESRPRRRSGAAAIFCFG